MKLKILKLLDLTIEYLIYGFIFFIPIAIAPVSIFSGTAVILFLIKQILSADFSTIKTHKTFFLILLAFFIFMALSLLNSGPLLGKSFHALYHKWGKFPFLLWTLLSTLRDNRRIVTAVWVLSLSATLIMLTTFSQKFFGLEFLRHQPLSGAIVTGPFKNQNDLAGYLTGIIPIILCFGLWKWQKISLRIGLLLLSLLLISISFLTLCRGGWVGLAAGLVAIALFINHVHLSKRMFWSIFSIGYLFSVPLLGALLLLFQNRGDSSRLILYRGAWKMITEHPLLGKGLGTFMDYCPQYTNNLGKFYAHNCFLQIWAESGIFSLICFLLLVGYVFYKNFKTLLQIGHSLESFILIGLNAGLLGFLVHSFFDTQLYSSQSSFLFWTIVGLCVALYSSLNQNETS